MNAAVGDQAFDRLLGDFAAVGIEAGQDDRAGRVVDDQVDAGGELERADVAPLAADDAALEIVARQIDHRHRRFDRVLGGAALDRFGDVVLGAVGRRFARFGVEALQQVRGVVARVAFDLLEQQLLGLVGGQAGDAFELVLLLRDEPLVLGGGGRRRPFALGQAALARRAAPSRAARRRSGARPAAMSRRRQRLLERRGGLADLRGLPLGLDQQLVGLLLGVEERFLLPAFGVALGVLERPQRLLFGAADGFGGDALAVRDPDGEDQTPR